MSATGVSATSRVTQRRPLGEVNRMDSQHRSSAKEPLREKSSLASGKAPVGSKPQSHSQLSHRPTLQLQNKERLKPTVVPVRKEQVCIKTCLLDRVRTKICRVHLGTVT